MLKMANIVAIRIVIEAKKEIVTDQRIAKEIEKGLQKIETVIVIVAAPKMQELEVVHVNGAVVGQGTEKVLNRDLKERAVAHVTIGVVDQGIVVLKTR